MRILPLLIAIMFVQACAPSGFIAVADPVAMPDRPNIILITAEDLGPRLGFMGDPVAVTPSLDRLASQSVVFTRAFTTAGVCAPSRAALITGVHQTTIGAHNMRTSSYGENMDEGAPYRAVPPPDVKAFPELLRAAGYFTINDFKTDYQFGNAFTVWDRSTKGADWNDRAPGQPFFAMINHEVTHEGRTWPPDTDPALHPVVSRRNSLNAGIDATKNFQLTDPERVRVPPYWPDTPAVRANLARFYDNIRVMDGQVGALLDRLEAEGRFADSIIIFTTDHGDGLPRHKRTIFDSGTHVPLLVRFPDGFGAGTQRGDLVSFIDLAPTILDWAGVTIPEFVQGRRLFDDPAPDAIYMAGDRFDEVPQRFRGVREERWHFIRYFSDKPILPSLGYQNVNPIMREMRRLHTEGGLSPLQASYLADAAAREFLFDTEADPDEVRNLADNPRFAAIKSRMSDRLEKWIEGSGDMGRIPERDLVARIWPGGQQPQTAMVEACLNSGGKVLLTSETKGASIGYGGADGEALLYARPIDATSPFRAKAVRYGYKPSPVAVIDRERLSTC
uniref:sulfatase family protein n=1 Tax=uncultured Altererythrobacter sp. TaxID=500840 RepID=UPI00263A0DFE|nr:sulfatase [uncultured Altererythrobacter sp.]